MSKRHLNKKIETIHMKKVKWILKDFLFHSDRSIFEISESIPINAILSKNECS